MSVNWLDWLFNILFWMCLLSPVLLLSGCIAYLVSRELSKHDNTTHPIVNFAKKMMILPFAFLFIMIGLALSFQILFPRE